MHVTVAREVSGLQGCGLKLWICFERSSNREMRSFPRDRKFRRRRGGLRDVSWSLCDSLRLHGEHGMSSRGPISSTTHPQQAPVRRTRAEALLGGVRSLEDHVGLDWASSVALHVVAQSISKQDREPVRVCKWIRVGQTSTGPEVGVLLGFAAGA